MGVNYAGYYKWCFRKDKKNRYETARKILIKLIILEHNKENLGIVVSDMVRMPR